MCVSVAGSKSCSIRHSNGSFWFYSLHEQIINEAKLQKESNSYWASVYVLNLWFCSVSVWKLHKLAANKASLETCNKIRANFPSIERRTKVRQTRKICWLPEIRFRSWSAFWVIRRQIGCATLPFAFKLKISLEASLPYGRFTTPYVWIHFLKFGKETTNAN